MGGWTDAYNEGVILPQKVHVSPTVPSARLMGLGEQFHHTHLGTGASLSTWESTGLGIR